MTCMTVYDGWKELIEQVEALKIDGPQLEVYFEDLQTLRYALVAMVIFNSKHEARARSWGYTLGIKDKKTLVISKVSLKN